MTRALIFLIALASGALAIRFAQMAFEPHPAARFVVVSVGLTIVFGGFSLAVLLRLRRSD